MLPTFGWGELLKALKTKRNNSYFIFYSAKLEMDARACWRANGCGRVGGAVNREEWQSGERRGYGVKRLKETITKIIFRGKKIQLQVPRGIIS